MRNIDKVRKLTIQNRELELQLENAKMDCEKAKYELGRYKKGVATRDEVISKLQEKIAGFNEILDILSAYISILAKDAGGEVKLNKEAVRQHLGEYTMVCSADEENYIINTMYNS